MWRFHSHGKNTFGVLTVTEFWGHVGPVFLTVVQVTFSQISSVQVKSKVFSIGVWICNNLKIIQICIQIKQIWTNKINNFNACSVRESETEKYHVAYHIVQGLKHLNRHILYFVEHVYDSVSLLIWQADFWLTCRHGNTAIWFAFMLR